MSQTKPVYVGPDDVARHLGVSAATVKRMALAGKIPSLKISRKLLRFDLARVDEALQQYERSAIQMLDA